MNYGTVSGYRAYHATRGRDTTSPTMQTDEAILASLLTASEWIDGTYRNSFGGTKIGMREQLREWPRQAAQDIYGYAIASDSVPLEVENATYEAAYKNVVTPGALSVDYKPSKYKSASVSGAVSVTYNTFDNAAEAQTKFPIIGQILAPILTATGSENASSLSGSVARV